MRAAIILAGGKGKRIGGNKHLRDLHGKPLVQHVVERASLAAEEIVVVVRNDENLDKYQNILPDSVRIVRDTMLSEAPIVGIMTGARAAVSEYSAFLSCDLAFLNFEALNYLFDQVHGFDAVVPQWPDGLLEPLHAVYKTRAAADAAEAALKAREYRNISVARRLKKVRYIQVDEIKRFDPELLTFFNVNTAEDLARAEKLMVGKSQ